MLAKLEMKQSSKWLNFRIQFKLENYSNWLIFSICGKIQLFGGQQTSYFQMKTVDEDWILINDSSPLVPLTMNPTLWESGLVSRGTVYAMGWTISEGRRE